MRVSPTSMALLKLENLNNFRNILTLNGEKIIPSNLCRAGVLKVIFYRLRRMNTTPLLARNNFLIDLCFSRASWHLGDLLLCEGDLNLIFSALMGSTARALAALPHLLFRCGPFPAYSRYTGLSPWVLTTPPRCGSPSLRVAVSLCPINNVPSEGRWA